MRRSHVWIIGLFYIAMLQIPTLGSAWSNGYAFYPYANAPSDYDRRLKYGTSDWFAEGVRTFLDTNNIEQWRWLHTFEEEYLLGTEAPYNENIHLILNRTKINGFGDAYLHRVKIDGNMVTMTSLMDRIIHIENQTLHYLSNHNYYVAAYYAGALVSYMSLTAFFPLYVYNGIDYINEKENYTNFVHMCTPNDNPQLIFQWNATNIIPFDAVNDTFYSVIDTVNIVVPLWRQTNKSIQIERTIWIANPNEYPYYAAMEKSCNALISTIANTLAFIKNVSGIDGNVDILFKNFISYELFPFLTGIGIVVLFLGSYWFIHRKLSKKTKH